MTIWCVGRNFAAHAREMGQNETPTEPMIFIKAGACRWPSEQPIPLPDWSQEIHFETELALRIGVEGQQFDAMTIAIDLTARDRQQELKQKGHPWTLAKSFIASCPMGPFVPLPPQGEFNDLVFTLKINGEEKQRGETRHMIYSPRQLLQYLQAHFPVRPGDVLLTGTPQGVGAVQPRDRLEAEIIGHVKAQWQVAP